MVLGKLIDNSEYHNGGAAKSKQNYPSQDQYVIGLIRPGTQISYTKQSLSQSLLLEEVLCVTSQTDSKDNLL